MKNHTNVEQEIRQLLREKGLRATAPRMAILTFLSKLHSPASHQQIMAGLPINTDKASVWRNLATLSEKGILHRINLGDRIWRYELVDPCREQSGGHPHFICDSCDIVHCLPKIDWNAFPSLPTSLQGIELRLQVSGRCRICIDAEQT